MKHSVFDRKLQKTLARYIVAAEKVEIDNSQVPQEEKVLHDLLTWNVSTGCTHHDAQGGCRWAGL